MPIFRTRTVAPFTITRSILCFSLLILLLWTAPADAGIEPTPFHGILVEPLGQAILGDQLPPPFLDVNNIGSSGLDGVCIDVGYTRSHVGPIRWMAPESIRDRSYIVVVHGSDSSGDLNFGMRAIDLGGAVEFHLLPGNLVVSGSPLELRLSHSGNPVYQGEGNEGVMPLFTSNAPPSGFTAGMGEMLEDFDPYAGKMKVSDQIREDLLVAFESGTQISVPGMGVFTADEARISHRLRHRDRAVLSSMDVHFVEPVGLTGSQRLRDVAVGVFGATMRGQGGAMLAARSSSATGDQLVLSNIGATGGDGLDSDFEHDEFGQFLVMDPATLPVPQVGQLMSIAVEGMSRGSRETIVKSSCRRGDSYFDILYDDSSTAPPTEVAFYLDDIIVGYAADPTAPIRVNALEYPRCAGALVVAATGKAADDPKVCYWFGVAVNMYSGTGEPILADEIRLTLPTLLPEVDRIDRIQLSPPNVAGSSVTLLGRPNRIHPPDPVWPWLSLRGLGKSHIVHRDIAARVANIGSSGQDGVMVEYPSSSDVGVQWHSPWIDAGSEGQRIAVAAHGAMEGDPDRPVVVGRMWHENADGEVQLGMDASALGAESITYNIYDDGVLVNSVTGLNGALALRMFVPPVGFSAKTRLSPTSTDPVFYIALPEDSLVGEIGGGPTKRMNKAELIEAVITRASSEVVIELVALSLRPTNLEWVVLDSYNGIPSPTDAPSTRGLEILRLHPNVPNPFNPRTSIAFELDRAGPASLRIHDARGQLIDVLHAGYLEAGSHQRIWNGLDQQGRSVASGVYYLQLEAVGTSRTQKMTLVR